MIYFSKRHFEQTHLTCSKGLPSIGRWNIHDGSAIEDAFEAPLSVLMFGTAWWPADQSYDLNNILTILSNYSVNFLRMSVVWVTLECTLLLLLHVKSNISRTFYYFSLTILIRIFSWVWYTVIENNNRIHSRNRHSVKINRLISCG